MGEKTTEKSITEFLIEDFKDTSAKLESTDKKVQFIVQIYVALIAAILSASLFFLANHFRKIEKILNNGLKTDNIVFPIFIIILLFLFGFAVCVYLYSLRGNYTHSIYIARMNFLRYVIFKKIGNDNSQIENFFYTQKSKPTPIGMGNVVSLFLAFTIGLYISLFTFVILILIVSVESILCFHYILVFVKPIILMFLLHFFVITKYYDKKLDNAIEKGWVEKN